MNKVFSIFAAGLLAAGLTSFGAAGSAVAGETWDMPTPYGDGNFHTVNIKAFAEDMGYDGPPFVWGEERRAQLHAQLDAW